MKIPNFIGEQQIVDKNGFLTEAWKKTFEQLFQELQSQMSDEGHVAPGQPTENLAHLGVPELAGGLIYDTKDKKLKVNLDGTIKEIQTV